ncbi:MAG: aldo/keto reductase [Oscillospiraceae bacterium]|nr:aldo/keto reductase [Oscillospiraceae bacterium]MBQ6698627.1 aldo/keto reductase [Oscillospiraceae bacterium]
MRYIEKNGYRISEMTLGTVQLGMNYGINNKDGKPSADTAAEILKTAQVYGVTSFDTAEAYGDSEELIGKYLSKSEVRSTVVTKFHFECEDENKLFDILAEKAKASAERLNVERLPFLMLHNEKYIKKYGRAVTDALVKLKKEGLADNIGVSFSDKNELSRLCDTDVFDCIQIPLNLFDNKELRDGTVKKLSDCGVTVFARSIYLNGLFFIEPERLPEKLQKAGEPLAQIRKIAEENEISVASLALSFIRASCGVGSIVLGCETPSQVKENAELFSESMLPESASNRILEISENIDPLVIHPWEWKL